jgi:opacity protein-like surface antigen
MKPFLPIAVLATLAISPASAQAASYTYKVTSATHTSTSHKTAEGYNGTSTARWSLAKPTRMAPNKMQVSFGPGFLIHGLTTVNATGTYGVDITTNWKNGRCAWTAGTNDQTYRGEGPGSFELGVGPDKDNPGKAYVVLFSAKRASLGNGYLGTECSTSLDGEPAIEATNGKTVSPGLFKKKTVTLNFAGSTNEEGIAYSWNTKIVLKRVKR